jgi:hypothetical protein
MPRSQVAAANPATSPITRPERDYRITPVELQEIERLPQAAEHVPRA